MNRRDALKAAATGITLGTMASGAALVVSPATPQPGDQFLECEGDFLVFAKEDIRSYSDGWYKEGWQILKPPFTGPDAVDFYGVGEAFAGRLAEFFYDHVIRAVSSGSAIPIIHWCEKPYYAQQSGFNVSPNPYKNMFGQKPNGYLRLKLM